MGRKHKLEKEEPGSGNNAMTSIVTAKKSKPSMKSRKKHHSDSEDSDVEMEKGEWKFKK